MLYDCARDAEPVPASPGAARSRVHDAAEPGADGLDAHRPRGSRRGPPELAVHFAERARGGVELMVTGGIAPNAAGWTKPFAGTLSGRRHLARHRLVTDAVRAAGGRICIRSWIPDATPIIRLPLRRRGARRPSPASHRANFRIAASNARYRHSSAVPRLRRMPGTTGWR